MTPRVTVIDALCGMGKTSYAIQMMNESSKVGFGSQSNVYESEKKYIYVTPFLNEVERIVNSTKAEFSEPQNSKISKYAHVKKLIEDEKNIVMTHELFSRLDAELLAQIEMIGYTLIMDEVANVLEQIKIAPRDIKVMLESKLIEVKENGLVKWIDEDYEPLEINRFRDIRVLAEKENLFIENNIAMFWTMDVKSFTCFKEVYILTYLFDSQVQKYYYDMHNLDYTKMSVIKNNDKYELTNYDKNLEPREHVKTLLKIYEDNKSATGRPTTLNSNYNKSNKDEKFLLSSTWFKNATEEELKQLSKNMCTFFMAQAKTSNSKLFWTTKKDIAPVLKNKKCILNKKDDRTKDNFLSFNVRATNDYADRTAMAFVYNRFMNPLEKKFFENRNIKVDENGLALSDLIQFLYRGCIRNNEKMNCYIPSLRMRKLLYDWLEFKV